MRVVVQRVASASVTVEGSSRAAIGRGLLVLVGMARSDTPIEARLVADKLVTLRLFPDEAGKMNRSVRDVGGAVLVVSQFTLLADIRKGRRPSFVEAADPSVAEPLVALLADQIRSHGVVTSTGVFGAHMEVALVNDGPVTLALDAHDGRVT